MDMNPSNLMASMLIGTVGLGIFMYGKKQQRLPQLVTGLVLMAFPYFVASTAWMFGIGAGVIAVLVVVVRAGL
jgi:hypothetical protein